MANTLQERYASMVDAKLRATLVTLETGASPIFNTNYEGSSKAGAVKIPVRDAEPSVRTYDKVNGLSGEGSSTTYITVSDFKDEAINEVIDGYDAAAVPDNIVADRLDAAGYAGGLVLDKDGIKELETAGTQVGSTEALTVDNVYGEILKARTALSKANVPTTGRWLIVSPDVMALLLDSPKFLKQSDIAQTLVQAGYVGQISGFAVKESNSLAEGTDFIAGHAQNATRIREWVVNPRVQSLEGDGKHIGASAVQGRWVYKHKVTKAVTIQIHKHA